jgi:hypothetical protein
MEKKRSVVLRFLFNDIGGIMNEEILKIIAKESVPIKSKIGLHIKEPHLLAFIAHEQCKQTELLSKILEVLEKQNTSTVNEVKTVTKSEEPIVNSKKEASK